MVNESTIQNLKRLQYLSEDQLAKLERTAIAHKRYSNIRFNIVFVDKKEVVVEVSQGRSLSENYADAEGLVRLTKEMIDNSMLSGRALRVGTKIYIKTDSDIVTTSWIKNKMSKVGMRAVDVEQYMSIDKSTLSLYLNGRRELTRKVKSDFFHRLRALILDDVYIGKEGSVYSVYRNGNSLQLSFLFNDRTGFVWFEMNEDEIRHFKVSDNVVLQHGKYNPDKQKVSYSFKKGDAIYKGDLGTHGEIFNPTRYTDAGTHLDLQMLNPNFEPDESFDYGNN